MKFHERHAKHVCEFCMFWCFYVTGKWALVISRSCTFCENFVFFVMLIWIIKMAFIVGRLDALSTTPSRDFFLLFFNSGHTPIRNFFFIFLFQSPICYKMGFFHGFSSVGTKALNRRHLWVTVFCRISRRQILSIHVGDGTQRGNAIFFAALQMPL